MKLGGTPVYQWRVDKAVRILESSARGSYPVILADKYDYYCTEYDPAKIAEGKNPRAYADFQTLHYTDASFDVVIASDVFEHVRNDADGYREIFRVLKRGGSLVLTVPYDHEQAETIRRVDTSGKEDVPILEPEYHGGGGHTLTYRNYGRDLLSLLRRVGFTVGYLEAEVAPFGITHQSVIIGRKEDHIELLALASPDTLRGSLGPLLPYRMFLLFKYNIKGFLHYWKQLRRK